MEKTPMMRAGYVQLVEEDHKPVGNRVAVLYDWRVNNYNSDIEADLYAREKKITLTSGRKKALLGLFNAQYELIMLPWPNYNVSGYGTFTINFDHYDPDRNLYTTQNTTQQITKYAKELFTRNGLKVTWDITD
jgi:hypothetical protein